MHFFDFTIYVVTGRVSKACGKNGHTRCGKKDIVKQWQWKTYGISFSYGGESLHINRTPIQLSLFICY